MRAAPTTENSLHVEGEKTWSKPKPIHPAEPVSIPPPPGSHPCSAVGHYLFLWTFNQVFQCSWKLLEQRPSPKGKSIYPCHSFTWSPLYCNMKTHLQRNTKPKFSAVTVRERPPHRPPSPWSHPTCCRTEGPYVTLQDCDPNLYRHNFTGFCFPQLTLE